MDESIQRQLEQRNEVADVLRRAKALILTSDRWFGHDLAHRYDENRLCAGLAILKSATGLIIGSPMHPAFDAFSSAIGVGRCDDGTCGPLVNWNNAPERTHAEVMTAFDKAISLAEAS